MKEINLTCTLGDIPRVFTDNDYRYEFSVPVSAGETAFRLRTSGIKADGFSFQSEERAIAVAQEGRLKQSD